MNIELLLEKIKHVESSLVDSGFKRDVEAWIAALSQPDTQSNLVRLKEIAESANRSITSLIQGGALEDLDVILPADDNLSDVESQEELQKLIEDPTVETAAFHSRLNTILDQVNRVVSQHVSNLSNLKTTLEVYAPDELETADDKALLAIIFNETEVIQSLPHFAKKLSRWDRTLRMYHSLVTNESPEDIGLAAVHGGSIDVVVDLKLDVALDIAEVLKYGFIALSAYFSYRVAKSDIVKSYGRNKELLELDKRQDELMLGNIKGAMEDVLKQKYLKTRRRSKSTDVESPEVKIEQISSLFSEHITKGNDVKLLTSGESEENESDDQEPTLSKQLSEESRKARSLRKQMKNKDLKLLESKYSGDDPNQAE